MDDRMDNLFDLVYANHIRQCIENAEDAFDYVNDLEVIRDYISELKLCNISDSIRNTQISKVCRAEWRCQKTVTWKRKTLKMVQSMIRVENWLTKTQ